MDLVQVEITSMAITARYGALKEGTILRTDAAYAAHLVDDCGAAKYVAAKVAKAVEAPQATAAPKRPAAARKKAASAQDEAGEQGAATTAPTDPAVDPGAAE